MSVVHTFRLDLTWDLLQAISRVDRFGGEWAGIERREGRSLKHMKSIATVQSVGASTRIEGSRLADPEVDALLAHLDITKLEDRDQQEVAGYFEALDTIGEAFAEIRVGESELKHLHKLTLQYSSKDAWHRGGYKQQPNAVEAVAADASRTVVFATTPPGMETEDAMRALVAWYGRTEQVHPLVRVALFCYEFVTIHPFQDGNGRMSRLLATLLLLQEGYPWVQYVSFEHEIERRKTEYYRVLRQCQMQRPGEEMTPWVHFFLDCLVVMMEKLRAKLEVKGTATTLNDRQRNILRYVQAHAGAQAGGIATALSLPLPTVKKDLEVMLRNNALVREGTGRGTHYSAH
ncbi:MAG: Fic family protein [Flavobacteriales bacterium]|nr:Fic family protein [Flavobacteriales bacterium]